MMWFSIFEKEGVSSANWAFEFFNIYKTEKHRFCCIYEKLDLLGHMVIQTRGLLLYELVDVHNSSFHKR